MGHGLGTKLGMTRGKNKPPQQRPDEDRVRQCKDTDYRIVSTSKGSIGGRGPTVAGQRVRLSRQVFSGKQERVDTYAYRDNSFYLIDLSHYTELTLRPVEAAVPVDEEKSHRYLKTIEKGKRSLQNHNPRTSSNPTLQTEKLMTSEVSVQHIGEL